MTRGDTSRKRFYDAIFSLGNTCGCALYLRQCDLRIMAGPLDWVRGSEGLLQRVALIESRFRDWMTPEKMTPLSQTPGYTFLLTKDLGTGIEFLHDVHGKTDFQTELKAVRDRYLRRQQRFFETVSVAEHTLLVWFNCRVPVTPERDLLEGFARLRKALGKDVELLAIEHDATLAHGERKDFIAQEGALRHFRLNLTAPGANSLQNVIQGDAIETVRALLNNTISLRPDLVCVAIRHRRKLWVKRKLRNLLAAFIPFKTLRRKMRGKA